MNSSSCGAIGVSFQCIGLALVVGEKKIGGLAMVIAGCVFMFLQMHLQKSEYLARKQKLMIKKPSPKVKPQADTWVPMMEKIVEVDKENVQVRRIPKIGDRIL